MYNIYDQYVELLPFVRIKKIKLDNFKGVQHGEIEFNCAKEFIPYNTKSDILGLYGQNGSGKSSMVEALDLLKGIICGYQIGPGYAKYIGLKEKIARITVELDFQYRTGEVATVSYEAKIEGKEKKVVSDSGDELEDGSYKLYLFISEEIIKTNMYSDGTVGRMHPIVDTKNKLFCGDSLEEFYYNKNDTGIKEELVYLKRKCYEDSRSFVFCNELSEIIEKYNTNDNYSKYYEILSEIGLYFSNFLFVISTRTSGLVQLRAGIPIYLPISHKPYIFNEKIPVLLEQYKYVENAFKQINMVLDTLIPGLQLDIKGTPTSMKNGEAGMFVKIMSIRAENTFPFDYESDGIIKIVSILADYIYAYNEGSATLVVDEFDSGVFEFLLGELLQIFESSGKGQFIFTSHNLRPLEVIDKKFIRFTTSDPDNRYCKLKNIGATNNLRDLYLREVQLGNQDIEIYKRTKSYKIVKALRAAREEQTSNDEK